MADAPPLLTAGCIEALRLEGSHMVAVSTNTVGPIVRLRANPLSLKLASPLPRHQSAIGASLPAVPHGHNLNGGLCRNADGKPDWDSRQISKI